MSYFNARDEWKEAEDDEADRLWDMLDPEEKAEVERERGQRARSRIAKRDRKRGPGV